MRKAIRNSVIAIAIITICAVWFGMIDRDSIIVSFVSVGQGDGAIITTAGGRHILIDTGPSAASMPFESAMKTYLIKSGITKVDIIVLSHYHADHYGGIIGIAKEFKTELIILPKPVNEEGLEYVESLAEEVGQQTAIVHMKMGENFGIDSEIHAEAIFYSDNSSDENDRSLVLGINCRGIEFLFTGDITVKAEERILQEVPRDKLDTDVLKVAHHGSKYSSIEEFLEASSPEFAVISVGKNMYGHPTQEAIGRIRRVSQMYRTDEHGTVEFVVGNGEIKRIRGR